MGPLGKRCVIALVHSSNPFRASLRVANRTIRLAA